MANIVVRSLTINASSVIRNQGFRKLNYGSLRCAYIASQKNTCSTKQTHRDPHKRSLLQERRPDYELDGSGLAKDGDQLVRPTLGQTTEVEEVRDPEIWKYVERLLPPESVPVPPKHDKYPTPSGWFPPTEKRFEYPYIVERTKYHNFPIYLKYTHVGLKAMTVLNRIEGDIWNYVEVYKANRKISKRSNVMVALSHRSPPDDDMTPKISALEADLRKFLEDKTDYRPDWPIMTQVDEIGRKVRLRGKYMEEVVEFLTERGM